MALGSREYFSVSTDATMFNDFGAGEIFRQADWLIVDLFIVHLVVGRGFLANRNISSPPGRVKQRGKA